MLPRIAAGLRLSQSMWLPQSQRWTEQKRLVDFQILVEIYFVVCNALLYLCFQFRYVTNFIFALDPEKTVNSPCQNSQNSGNFYCTTYMTPLHSIRVFTLIYAVPQLVQALCYKPEDRGFDSQWGHWNFLLAIGSTQPLIEMSTRYIWRINAAGA